METTSSNTLHICLLTRVVLAHGLGGMQLHTEALRQGLTERGHRVTIITTAHPQGTAVLTDAWGETHFVGNGPPATYTAEWRTACLKTLLKLHNADPFNLVAGNGKAVYGYLEARSALPAEQRLPAIVITHNNIICDFQQQFGQVLRRPLSLLRWLPYGIALYVGDLRWMCYAERITAVSETTAHALRRWFLLDPERIEVIENGIDTASCLAGEAQREHVRHRLGIADDTCLILAVGRLAPDKGHHYLIDALRRLEVRNNGRLFRLALVGDGPLRAELEAEARSWGLADQITFVGPLPNDEVPGWLWAADLLVLPSLVEGAPLTLLEAMTCGRPVVASKVGAIPALLQEGKTGFLVPAGRSAPLAKALALLISNPEFAHQMGKQAQAVALAHHDQRQMIGRFEEVFVRTVAQKVRLADHR